MKEEGWREGGSDLLPPRLECRRGPFKLPVAAATGAGGAAFVPQSGRRERGPDGPGKPRPEPPPPPGARPGGGGGGPGARPGWCGTGGSVRGIPMAPRAGFPGPARPREASD